MVTGVKKDHGDFMYMRLQKHNCPDCGQPTFVKKVKRRVHSSSRRAKNYDFTVGDTTLSGNVKFIWYEFKCKGCGNQYTEAEMKAFEEEQKREEKAAKKAQKKKAKKVARQAKRAVKAAKAAKAASAKEQ